MRGSTHLIGPRFVWTEAHVERLKALAADGRSCSEIAKALSTRAGGPSRNAVLGKLHRLGVRTPKSGGNDAGRRASKAPAPRPRAIAPSKWKPYVEGMGEPKPPGMVQAEQERERLAAEARAVAPPCAKPMHELGLRDCRWPVGLHDGSHVFCGCAATRAFGYCTAHAAQQFSGRPLAAMTSEADDPFKRERRRA